MFKNWFEQFKKMLPMMEKSVKNLEKISGEKLPSIEISYKGKPIKFEDYLICVGRIEPRKNQLNVINAVKLLREEEAVIKQFLKQ